MDGLPAHFEPATDVATSDAPLIIKVRKPQAGDTHVQAVAEDGRAWRLPLTDKLVRRIGAQSTRYFFAKPGGQHGIRIDNYAPWQPW